MDCVYLGQDREKWRAVANTRMNFLVLKRRGSYALERFVASEGGLSCME